MNVQKYLKEYFLYGSNNRKVYKIPTKVFLELDVERWKYNRPADEQRVKEIRKSYKIKKHMAGCIFLAECDGDLVCYDGNHRRLALISCVRYLIVDIMWNVSSNEIKQEFIDINKCVSVPELYKENNNYEIRIKIDEWVCELCKKYPRHVSSSPHPHRPNFNRDNMVQEIMSFYEDEGKSFTIDNVLSGLVKLNKKYKKGWKVDKKEVSEKCLETDFYLYCYERTFNTKHLLRIMERELILM